MDFLDGFIVRPLDGDNAEQVFSHLITKIKFYRFTKQMFIINTLKDETFDPNLTMVVYKGEKEGKEDAIGDGASEMPIAFFLVVCRKVKFPIRRTFHIKFMVVSDEFQRQGIGTEMFNQMVIRIKEDYQKHFFILYDLALTRYIFPGVDPRFTSLYYFLKERSKFKRLLTFKSMTFPVEKDYPEPPTENKDVYYSRTKPEDKEATLKFVEEHFSKRWAIESGYCFESDPPSIFIAKNRDGDILGFAAHNIGFVGRFGPTGVNEKIRGKGIGGILLKWCIWDLSQQGIDECIISWIGPGIFYSKAINAYLSPLYYAMLRFVW